VSVELQEFTLGDGRRTAKGRLIVSEGSFRGILSVGAGSEVHFALACDRRIEPEEGIAVPRSDWHPHKVPA
jgi:hypothetical protein